MSTQEEILDIILNTSKEIYTTDGLHSFLAITEDKFLFLTKEIRKLFSKKLEELIVERISK